MKRKAHALEPNKTIETPRYMVFIDTESRVDEITLQHEVYLLCAVFVDMQENTRYQRDYIGNKKVSEVWDDIVRFGGKRGKKVYVFAHNMFYDLVTSRGIKHITKYGFRVENYFEKGSTFILNFIKRGKVWDKKKQRYKKRVLKTIQLLSTTNYFPESLASLGKTFGLEKLDFDYNEGSVDDAVIYCRRDVEIIEKAMKEFIKFIQDEDLGCFGKTIPAQAFNSYRHRFNNTTIYIHDHEQANELEREAYSGGRVECFRIGYFEGNFYCYDINSMYPAVMKDNKFPVGLKSYVKRTSPHYIADLIERGFLVVARCKIETNKPVMQAKLGENLLFPVGNFWTTLSTPEIKYCIENKLLQETAEAAVYEGGYIFSEYVNYFYNKRQRAKKEGDGVRNKMYKLFLNSLYGKFGQKSPDYEWVDYADPERIEYIERYDRETGEKTNFKIFGGSVFKQIDEDESFNSFPAIAAHVTANARMMILDLIEKAGFNNTFYSDTDSVFVNEKGKEKLEKSGLVDPYELGKIDLEKSSSYIKINAPKDYEFHKTIKMKGVKKGSEKINDDTYKTYMWGKLNSFIREGQLENYHNETRVKVLTRQYNKGWVVKNNSGKVEPFTLYIDENNQNKLEITEKETKKYKKKKKDGFIYVSQQEIITKKYKKYI